MRHMNIQKKSGGNFYRIMVMKIVCLLVAILSVAFVNSCTTYYYVRTDVTRNMDVERHVYASSEDGSSVDFPFETSGDWKLSKLPESLEIDFYDTKESMTHEAYRSGRIEDVSLASEDAFNPLLRPVERLGKRFRWFYTYYDYNAEFKGLKDRLPIPFDGYFTDAQLELFFRGANPPEGWNGVEMYCLLDDINQSFAKWHSDATYFVMCDVFEPYCTKQQIVALDTLKNNFMEGIELEVMFAMKPDEFEDRLAAVLPDSGFGNIYEYNADAIDKAYEKESEIIGCFETSFMYTVNLPGRYMDGNAVDFMDKSPMWKVDAYRLMCGDLKLSATSRQVNVWAFLVTFAVIVLLLQVFAKTFASES